MKRSEAMGAQSLPPVINAFICGLQKAGTSSLYHWLGQHPSITTSLKAKDYPAFSKEDGLQRERIATLASWFVEDGRVDDFALSTDANLIYSQAGLRRLYEYNRQTKLVILIRHPLQRISSAWGYARERGLELRTLDVAVSEELDGKEFPWDSYEGRQMNYIKHSFFVDKIEEAKKLFGGRGVLVVPFGALVKHPSLVVTCCLQHFGLSDEKTFDYSIKNATASRSRSSFLNKILYREKNSLIFKLLRSGIRAEVRAGIRNALVKFNRVGGRAELSEPLEIKLEHKLTKVFQRELVYLSDLESAFAGFHDNP